MCVDAYPASQSRAEIMSGLESIHGRLVGLSITGEMWVDGSFLTKKEEPDDVDVVVIAPSVFFDHGSTRQIAYLDWLSEPSTTEDRKALFSCHTYAFAQYSAPHVNEPLYLATRAGYADAFGHSVVAREPKGIAVVSLYVAPKAKEDA